MATRSRQLLAALALLVALLPSTAAGNGGTVDERWPIALNSGTRITAVLRRPVDVTEPLPAVLLFGGFEGAARVLDYIETDAPLIRVSFVYPWEVPPGRDLWSVPAHLRAFDAAVDDTFAGITALVRALRRRPDVDAGRIAIAGASAGAPFATIAAAREGIPAVIIVQGFGELAAVIGRQLELYLEPQQGFWARPVSWLLGHYAVWALELPHPEDAARRYRSGQQVLMINALDDARIPRHATESLWSAVAASDAHATRIDLPGGHLYGYGDPAIGPILARAMDWMEKRGLLDAARPERPQADP